jgi:catechol 2,3-dioxygenase-like lactoylglutathione lyase family enzyme
MEERPAVWVGHLTLRVTDIPKTVDFFVKLGMRPIEQHGEVAVLELRGGTHLVLLPAGKPPRRGAKAPFDLMVDDLDASRERYSALGLSPSEIGSAPFHRFFTVVEPSGHEITVNSSHVSERPV